MPRHVGTGGQVRILGISKRGDRYLRTLLIHGARAAAYAHARAVLVNLGPCTFELDRVRDSADGRPVDLATREFFGGKVLDFGCKRPDPSHWSVVLWRLKRQPRRPVAATRIS